MFPDGKPVLGMLHLRGESAQDKLEVARTEIDLLVAGGVDALVVEDYFGSTEVAEEVLKYLAAERPDLVYGVNMLRDHRLSFEFAGRYGARFVQLDSVAGHLTPDEDEAFAAELQELRERTGVHVLGGVRFKYQPYRSGRTLAEDLAIAVTRCDAVVVTGPGTGVETGLDKIEEFRALLGPDFPLIVGAGITDTNVFAQLASADGAIVGSFFKQGHRDDAVMEAAYIRRLMDSVQAIRAGRDLVAIRAVPAAEIDFSPYGEITRLTGEGPSTVESSGDGWQDVMTRRPLLRAPGHLGMTLGSGAPFVTRRMERHLYTEEAILCMASPVVLPVAAPTEADAPAAEDVRAVILSPGEVAVLKPGTWHDACHGVEGPAHYYWMATSIDGVSSPWVEITGGSVAVSC
ncbi:BtpA/SgcQ family protein [Streptomyces sp. NPDC002513]